MTFEASLLLCGLLFAHFLGDFTPLSTSSMRAAKAVGKPLGPIAAHAVVHGILVGIVIGVMAPPTVPVLGIAIAVEFGTHLAIDWVRGILMAANPNLADPSGQGFWTLLGFDQLAHGLVLVGLAFLVL